MSMLLPLRGHRTALVAHLAAPYGTTFRESKATLPTYDEFLKSFVAYFPFSFFFFQRNYANLFKRDRDVFKVKN